MNRRISQSHHCHTITNFTLKTEKINIQNLKGHDTKYNLKPPLYIVPFL